MAARHRRQSTIRKRSTGECAEPSAGAGGSMPSPAVRFRNRMATMVSGMADNGAGTRFIIDNGRWLNGVPLLTHLAAAIPA